MSYAFEVSRTYLGCVWRIHVINAGADAGAGVDGIAVGGDVVGGVGDMKILYGGRRRRIWKR